MKEHSYMKALRALREGRNTNPAHKDAFNSFNSDLKILIKSSKIYTLIILRYTLLADCDSKFFRVRRLTPLDLTT